MDAKPVILISSCKADAERGYNQVIRDTWGKISLVPYRFVMGDYTSGAQDEIALDCPDNYFSLPLKTALSVKWALQNGFTHSFRAFTDTYIDTGRLLKSGFEEFEYVGNMCGFCWNGFMHGGPGYWLGPLAMQIVGNEFPQHARFEDQFVGRLMMQHNIAFTPDFRYSLGQSYHHRESPCLPENDIISEHLSNSGIYEVGKSGREVYSAAVMTERHALRYPTRQFQPF